jgi:hypothetical protein
MTTKVDYRSSGVVDIVINKGLEDGCKMNGASPIPPNVIAPSQRAAVRCCSHDGMDCITPQTCLETTYDDAERKCTTLGRRLCTATELANDKCCSTGCGFDAKLTWYTGRGSGVVDNVILRNNTINVDGVNVRSLRVSCLSTRNPQQLGEDYIGLIIWHQAHNHRMIFNGRRVYPGYIIYAKKSEISQSDNMSDVTLLADLFNRKLNQDMPHGLNYSGFQFKVVDNQRYEFAFTYNPKMPLRTFIFEAINNFVSNGNQTYYFTRSQ